MFIKRRQGGVTIVELIIFIVIVGVAAAGIMQVLSLASRNSADPIRRKQAMLIAEAYMEEVQQAQMTACDPQDPNAATAKTIADCASQQFQEVLGPESGNTSRPYDNVNDYVTSGYSLSNPTAVRAFAPNGVGIDRDVAGNPLGANSVGTALGNVSLDGIVTTLTLRAATLGPTGLTAPVAGRPDLDALRITITVTYGPGPNDVITLDGYRTRYAPEAR
jgi:MSHA pilin protein MshD